MREIESETVRGSRRKLPDLLGVLLDNAQMAWH